MEPQELIEAWRDGRAVILKPGSQLALRQGRFLRNRHQPAAWIMSMPFRDVMRLLPDLVLYIKKEDREKEAA